MVDERTGRSVKRRPITGLSPLEAEGLSMSTLVTLVIHTFSQTLNSFWKHLNCVLSFWFLVSLNQHWISLIITRMTISTLLILAVRRTHVIHEPSSVPARHESFVAQWLEHPTGGRKVLSSVPIGNSVFSLSCARDMLITSFLIRIYQFFFPLIFSYPISLDIPFLIANVSCN